MGLKFPVIKVAALLSFLWVVGLTGCGQKGDLYREAPSQKPLAQIQEPSAKNQEPSAQNQKLSAQSAEPAPVPLSETSGQAR